MSWYHVVAKTCKILGLYKLILDRENSEPYLHRYYLFNTRWLAPLFPKLSYRIVLHNIVKSDIDGLHDHPWSWKSRIVAGGYWEDTLDGKFWRSPKDGWRSRKAGDFHRLVLDTKKVEVGGTWTLFIMGPKEKEWGFLSKDNEWVHWKTYIDNRNLYT